MAANAHRAWLFEGILRVADALADAGCRRMYLAGNYVTSEARPSQFQGCWEPAGVKGAKLDPILLDFTDDGAAQKERYRGTMSISCGDPDACGIVLKFYQTEK